MEIFIHLVDFLILNISAKCKLRLINLIKLVRKAMKKLDFKVNFK